MLIVIGNGGHQSADTGGENETGLVRFTIQGAGFNALTVFFHNLLSCTVYKYFFFRYKLQAFFNDWKCVRSYNVASKVGRSSETLSPHGANGIAAPAIK